MRGGGVGDRVATNDSISWVDSRRCKSGVGSAATTKPPSGAGKLIVVIFDRILSLPISVCKYIFDSVWTAHLNAPIQTGEGGGEGEKSRQHSFVVERVRLLFFCFGLVFH